MAKLQYVALPSEAGKRRKENGKGYNEPHWQPAVALCWLAHRVELEYKFKFKLNVLNLNILSDEILLNLNILSDEILVLGC